MKGKLLIFFLLALVALVVVGIIGRTTITQAVDSVRAAASNDPKQELLDDILQNLLQAESSVRTYTITGNEDQLSPFSQATSKIDRQISELNALTTHPDQRAILTEMKVLIEQKFGNYSSLISLKSTKTDSSALERVMADIDAMTAADTTMAGENGAVYEKLFGENEETLLSDSLFEGTQEDLQSQQVEEAISRIQEESQRAERQRSEEELQLTQRDYEITLSIRERANAFQQIDQEANATTAQNVTAASAKANNYITWIIAITLFVFGVLIYILFNDLIRDQRNKEALTASKERAEKLAKVKEEFLANMSHEIRTPLNAVIGFSNQLSDKGLSREEAQTVAKIRQSGSHLLDLVNDLLDSAKLESGNIVLENTGFSVINEIHTVTDLFSGEAQRKSIHLESMVDPNIPTVVIGDAVRFRQILINLVSNAIKFTDAGTIRIKARLLDPESRPPVMELIISDSGIGIAQEQLSEIFKEFTQADSSTTRKYGGTGLGLSIVNRLILLHNGTINVDSAIGKGTSFTITLPIHIGSQQDLPEVAETNIPHLNGKEILIVDDQPFNLEIIEAMLRETKCNITTLSSGSDALDILLKQKFDIVLLDVQMPEISGLEITKKIRVSDSPNATTRIIAFTAGATESEVEQIYSAGMDDVIHKPVDAMQLYTCIEAKTERSENTEVEISALKSLANGDDAFVQRMLKLFRENIATDQEKLDSAIKVKDLKSIKSLAHKMIPPCRHLGFDGLVNTLREIESAQSLETVEKNSISLNTQITHALDAVEKELGRL